MNRFFRRIADTFKMASSVDILAAIAASYATKSGATVNWRTALQAVTALACARVIAEGMAQIPFKVMQKNGNMRIPLIDDPLYKILHDSPNEFMTSYEFRETMGLHLVFAGEQICFINRLNGVIQEILPYEPGQVEIKREKWKSRYFVRLESGETQEIPRANIWHIKGPSWNGWQGMDGVKLVRNAIGLEIATEEHGSLLFKNGAQLSGLLSTEQNLSPIKQTELRDSWKADGGGDNRFKIKVLWAGMKYTPMALTNDESQFLETRKFQVEEVCRGFRVMPIMIGFSDKASTYASAEQMFIAHVVHTLNPWLVRIEQSADKDLLTDQERKENKYTKFTVNSLMRGAAKDRVAFYKEMVGMHAMTPNEVRELEDMNPIDGGDEFPVLQGQATPEDNSDEGGQNE